MHVLLRAPAAVHGVEEMLQPEPPPYLLLTDPVTYTVTDATGISETVEHSRHDFDGWGQRYERLVELMPPGSYHTGKVGAAVMQVFEAEVMLDECDAVITPHHAPVLCGESLWTAPDDRREGEHCPRLGDVGGGAGNAGERPVLFR